MSRSMVITCVLAGGVAVGGLSARATAQGQGPTADFGLFIADQLRAHSEQLFGFTHPLAESLRAR